MLRHRFRTGTQLWLARPRVRKGLFLGGWCQRDPRSDRGAARTTCLVVRCLTPLRFKGWAYMAQMKKSILVADLHPVVAEGVRTILGATDDLEFAGAVSSLVSARELLGYGFRDVLLLDKDFGHQAVTTFLGEVRGAWSNLMVVVWGSSMSNLEAARLLQAGANGLLSKSASIEDLVVCLRTVGPGAAYVPRDMFQGSTLKAIPRTLLTKREQEVVERVMGGASNSEIAKQLAIAPGTVKVFLRHIYEKTGIRGRHALALAGLQDRARHFTADC